MNVLISAYSCEPGRGSERGVGWNVAREVSKKHKVWVLTRPDESKSAIEAELALHPNPNLNFVYFTLPFWKDSLRLGQSGAMQVHYYLWQIQAYFVAKELHKQINFDVFHHVTFVKYSAPSLISFLPVPFVWGPVGGAESAPSSFSKEFSFKAKLYELARSLSRTIGENDPLVSLTIKNSSAIRATTQDTAQRLSSKGASFVDVLPEVGLLSEEIQFLNSFPLPSGQPIRFICIGRLLHWKGFHLGLQAFAKANIPEAEFWVVGDGPERDNLQLLASSLDIEEQVTFFGRLQREDALDCLSQSHVLVHPSLHDSGGWVCIEAMAAGRPVICLDLGGPATQVTSEAGFKIPALSPPQAIQELAEAMCTFADKPELRVTMGQAAKSLVDNNYDWKVVGERLNEVYSKITADKS